MNDHRRTAPEDAAQSPPARRQSPPEHAPQSPPARRLSPWSLLLAGAVVATMVMGQWVWLVGILGLALLITVHEFGHFLAAKLFGMRVEKFYVGFPPAALRHTRGETEYGVGIIPLGGFCKISGMTPEEDVPPGTGDRVYYRKPVWQRNLAIFAGPLMNFVAAAVILILFVAIQGVQTATLTIAEVVPDGPAATAGIEPDDVLVGADGLRFTTWDEASAYFRANLGETIRVVYVSGSTGDQQTATATLVENPQLPGSGYMGVRAEVVGRHPGPIESVKLGLEGFRAVVAGFGTGMWWLISGKISATGPDGAVGPVGILNLSRDAVQQSWYPFLLAYLSFNLGVINLLPILPFDGGHIAVNLLERVRGRRLDTKVFERVMAFGTVLLVALFIFLTFNDVKRIFGG